MTPEKDPLLEELEERIYEGPVIFTPDALFAAFLPKVSAIATLLLWLMPRA